MESFIIKGGVPLHGEVEISGSKNAALPIMAAALLTDEPCVIRRVPDLSDTRFMVQILESLGATAKLANGMLTVRAKKIRGYADYELVRKMRGSICIAGPLLARLRKARISLPGGCIIGARPINLHLKGFAALGAKIKIEGILQEGRLGQWFAEGEHGTLIGKIQPVQDLQQRALPAAIRTQDDQAFPRRDRKVNLIQGRDLLIVGKTQVRYTKYQLVFHE